MGKKKKKQQDTAPQPRTPRLWAIWAANVGLLLIMAATIIPLINLIVPDYCKYIYTAGAAAVLVGRLFNVCPYTDDLRLARLYRIDSWVGVIFSVGAFFLWYQKGGIGPMDWLAFTLAGAFLTAYTSIMIPRATKKYLQRRAKSDT